MIQTIMNYQSSKNKIYQEKMQKKPRITLRNYDWKQGASSGEAHHRTTWRPWLRFEE
jgi:hypothetical protein